MRVFSLLALVVGSMFSKHSQVACRPDSRIRPAAFVSNKLLARTRIVSQDTPASTCVYGALQYSTKSDDGPFVDNDEMARAATNINMKAYQLVASQDPEWYNQFVTNVLGKEVVEESGRPMAIASKRKSPRSSNDDETVAGTKDFSTGSKVAELVREKQATTEITGREGETTSQEGNEFNSNITVTDNPAVKAEEGDQITAPVNIHSNASILTRKMELEQDQDIPEQNSDRPSLQEATFGAQPATKEKAKEPDDMKISKWTNPIFSQPQQIPADQSTARGPDDMKISKGTNPISSQPQQIPADQTAAIEPNDMKISKGTNPISSQPQQIPAIQTTFLEGTETSKQIASKEIISPTEPDKVATLKEATSNSETKDDKGTNKSLQVGETEKEAIMLAKLTTLGYSADEVAQLNAEVRKVILEDEIGRPSSGIPPTWSNRLVQSSGGAGLVQNPTSGSIDAVAKDKVKISEEDTRPAANAKTVKLTAEATEVALSPPNIPKNKNEEVSSSVTSGSAEDEIIVFLDMLTPLSMLCSLGYTKDDLVGLRCDIFATILANRTPRPATGVPRQWKAASDGPGNSIEEVVEVLPKAEAEALVKKRRSRDRIRQQNRKESSPTAADQRWQKPDELGEKTSSRERRAFNPDGSPKNVYDGRQKAESTSRQRQRMADPPTRYWPSMDTFRDLLRQEAAFRMRFVGDDYVEAIKDECDWRLDLYRDWLWALQKGIANPVMGPNRRKRGYGPHVKMEGKKPKQATNNRPKK